MRGTINRKMQSKIEVHEGRKIVEGMRTEGIMDEGLDGAGTSLEKSKGAGQAPLPTFMVPRRVCDNGACMNKACA